MAVGEGDGSRRGRWQSEREMAVGEGEGEGDGCRRGRWLSEREMAVGEGEGEGELTSNSLAAHLHVQFESGNNLPLHCKVDAQTIL